MYYSGNEMSLDAVPFWGGPSSKQTFFERYLPFLSNSNLCKISKALLLVATLLYKSTVSLSFHHGDFHGLLTCRDNNPKKVHEKVVDPKVECFWSRMRDPLEEKIVQARRIV